MVDERGICCVEGSPRVEGVACEQFQDIAACHTPPKEWCAHNCALTHFCVLALPSSPSCRPGVPFPLRTLPPFRWGRPTMTPRMRSSPPATPTTSARAHTQSACIRKRLKRLRPSFLAVGEEELKATHIDLFDKQIERIETLCVHIQTTFHSHCGSGCSIEYK